MKHRQRIILLAALIGISLPTLATAAVREHAVRVDFAFDTAAVSDKSVIAYRLYREGELACESDTPAAQHIDCTLVSDTGVFNFTLAAVYDDGSQSPQSPPFPFTVFDETSPLLGLQVLAGQTPDGISGIGDLSGTTAVELADVIKLLRQQAATQ